MTTILRRLAFASLLAAVSTYAVVHLRGPNGLPALLEKRETIRALEEENRRLRLANDEQARRNHELEYNEDQIRQEIQRRLNKVPDGAMEFRIDDAVPGEP
jgi:cell division protein FtsB